MDDELPWDDPHYMQCSHVQLALKYSRQPLGQLDQAHKELLDYLLAPYYREHFCKEEG